MNLQDESERRKHRLQALRNAKATADAEQGEPKYAPSHGSEAAIHRYLGRLAFRNYKSIEENANGRESAPGEEDTGRESALRKEIDRVEQQVKEFSQSAIQAERNRSKDLVRYPFTSYLLIYSRTGSAEFATKEAGLGLEKRSRAEARAIKCKDSGRYSGYNS
jgi:hypothetical protein